MNVYILFTRIFPGCNSKLSFLIEKHNITITYGLTVLNLQKFHEKGLTDEIA